MSDFEKNSENTEEPQQKNISQELNNEIDSKISIFNNEANNSNSSSNPSKIEINLRSAGNAPILKRRKFLLDRSKNVKFIIEWLKRHMRLEPKEQIFLYVNQEFAPSPDAEIGTIYDCFRTGNSVIFYYCTTPAWG